MKFDDIPCLVWCHLQASLHPHAQTNWPPIPAARAHARNAQACKPPDHLVSDRKKRSMEDSDITGRGWSSRSYEGDRIFLTTVVSSREDEEPKKGTYFGGDRPKPPTQCTSGKSSARFENRRSSLGRQVHEANTESKFIVREYASETRSPMASESILLRQRRRF